MLLPPHHRNFGKRLTKTPKLYFYDPGLAAWLAGVESPRQLAVGAMRGPLFETWVVSEFVKHRCNRSLPQNLYYWRDSSGHEIDLIVERGERLFPVEFKAGQTIAGDWFDTLGKFAGWSGNEGAASSMAAPVARAEEHRSVRMAGHCSRCRTVIRPAGSIAAAPFCQR
jgi:hypothetical protein